MLLLKFSQKFFQKNHKTLLEEYLEESLKKPLKILGDTFEDSQKQFLKKYILRVNGQKCLKKSFDTFLRIFYSGGDTSGRFFVRISKQISEEICTHKNSKVLPGKMLEITRAETK